MTVTRQFVLSRVEAFCAGCGMTERQFGYAAIGDGRFVGRLRAGKVTLALIEQAEAFMAGQAVDARHLRRRSLATAKQVAA